MRKEGMMLCLPVFIAALSACQSPSVRIADCPDVDIPAMTIKKREPNLTRRLLNEFYLSDETETRPSGT